MGASWLISPSIGILEALRFNPALCTAVKILDSASPYSFNGRLDIKALIHATGVAQRIHGKLHDQLFQAFLDV